MNLIKNKNYILHITINKGVCYIYLWLEQKLFRDRDFALDSQHSRDSQDVAL